MSDLTATQVAQLASRIARIPETMARWYGTTVTAAYTLTPQDRELRVDTTSGAITVTLPLANTVPLQVFTIKNVADTGYAVTIARAGTDTIDGATSLTIPPLQAVTIVSAVANRWDITDMLSTVGTWTPVIGGAGGTSGQSYTFQRGLWVKSGGFVWAGWEVLLSNKGTITGQAQIQGFPFAANAAMGNYVDVGGWDALATAVIRLTGYIQATTSVLALYKTTAAATSATGTTLVTGDINNTTLLAGSIVYRV